MAKTTQKHGTKKSVKTAAEPATAAIDPRFLSFGRFARGVSELEVPEDVDGVRAVFAKAAGQSRRVVIHGGGHAFDGQAVHREDDGKHILISSERFKGMDFREGGLVRLCGGTTWKEFLREALRRATEEGVIRLPGSIQTGREATIAGTLAGNCLSRFSGTMGREVDWVESFSIVTADGVYRENVSRRNMPDLFHAVVGGFGYFGFVTEATYRVIDIPAASLAQTEITTFEAERIRSRKPRQRAKSLRKDDRRVLGDVLREQLRIIRDHQSAGVGSPRAVSSALYTPFLGGLRGGVFDSVYGPRVDERIGFPLYNDTATVLRSVVEEAVRLPLLNLLVHDILFAHAREVRHFQNDIENFLFFMDANTTAKKRFERRMGMLFPIVQQTWVIPVKNGNVDAAIQFSSECLERADSLDPVEFDILFSGADDAWMSANYGMSGFAVSVAFEPLFVGKKQFKPRLKIRKLCEELSESAQALGGRIHPVKNVIVKEEVFRRMFSPQIERFEKLKRQFDPALILRNHFSDTHFRFSL